MEVEEQEDLCDEQQEPNDDHSYEEEDEEPKRKKKKPDFVTLKVPYNILNNSSLVNMMDCSKISDHMGVGLVAATPKACQIPVGGDVNLNEFTLSRTSIQRKQAQV